MAPKKPIRIQSQKIDKIDPLRYAPKTTSMTALEKSLREKWLPLFNGVGTITEQLIGLYLRDLDRLEKVLRGKGKRPKTARAPISNSRPADTKVNEERADFGSRKNQNENSR